RRAHGQPRFGAQGRDHGAARAAQRRAGHHHRDGDARAGHGGVRLARRRVPGRPHRRRAPGRTGPPGGCRMIRATLLMALREIRRNTLRSFLTMLGIVIGVGAVIALVTIGEGATARVTADIGKLGTNLLIVTPGGDRRSGAFTAAQSFKREDATALAREVSGIERVAPTATRQALAVSGNRNLRTQVVGTTPDYLDVRAYTVERGRRFTDAEAAAGTLVCVIGATVARELFGAGDAVGVSIRLDKLSCE